MKRTRDLTERQFHEALRRNGIGLPGFMGYCDLGNGCSASAWNRPTRREKLAYLIECKTKRDRELDSRQIAGGA